MTTTRRRTRRDFGQIRCLRSGRYQASFVGPDLVRRNAPHTFEAKVDAEGWVAARRREISTEGDDWEPPKPKPRVRSLREYAEGWLVARLIKPRTRVLYRQLLDTHILPVLGDTPLPAITSADVREWHAALRDGRDPSKPAGATAKSNAYSLLRAILTDAVDEELIARNPCRIKGAGTKRRRREIQVLTREQMDALVEAIPPRYKMLVLVSGWCALRFGEVAALRRSDVDLKAGVLHVRRALTAIAGEEKFLDDPKAESRRYVEIPPHVIPALKIHLRDHAAFGRDELVFPPANGDGFLALSTLHVVFDRAAATAGRPDLTVHDLRHFGAIQYARAGATLGELQQRLGHRTASAALIYQSAISERGADLTRRMSEQWAEEAGTAI
jgi:integrase